MIIIRYTLLLIKKCLGDKNDWDNCKTYDRFTFDLNDHKWMYVQVKWDFGTFYINQKENIHLTVLELCINGLKI